MKALMIGANRYIRGAGVLAEVGEVTSILGTRAFIIGGRTALSESLPVISESLTGAGTVFTVNPFLTEVCFEQADVYARQCALEQAHFVMGVGGGKALDVAKWTADICRLPCVTVPTCASTCACMVSLIVTYHANGQADKGIYSQASPWLCMADETIIARSPMRLTVAGIADTLSKWPETHYAMRAAEDSVFNYFTSGLGDRIYCQLLAQCPSIIENMKAGKADRRFGEILDIIFFMSAMVGNTAGDDYRLAIAHSVHDGLIAVKPAVIHNFFHGEKVAYGTLVQLALLRPEVSDDQLREVYRLFCEWGLPVSIKEFGLTDSRASLNALVNAALSAKLQAGPSRTSVEALRNAIQTVEAMGR